MSLLNLLQVGNSFAAVEDHPSRYKMRRENLLPHFGDGDPAEAVREPPPSMRNLPAPPAAAAQPLIAQDLFDTGVRSGAWSASGSKSAAPARPPIPCAYPGGRWSMKRAFSLSREAAARTEAGPEAAPAQRDVPWENIPVARNDLSEADVELVTVARKPEPCRGASPAPKARARAGSFLDRLKARFVRGVRK